MDSKVPLSAPHGLDKVKEALDQHVVLLTRVFYSPGLWYERLASFEVLHQRWSDNEMKKKNPNHEYSRCNPSAMYPVQEKLLTYVFDSACSAAFM
jgi:hypothetical protein